MLNRAFLRFTFHESFYLQLVIFDDRVAEKLVAGFVDLFAGGIFVGAGQLDFEIFTDVDGADALIAHVLEGVLNGFALRVEHGFLRSDDDLCFHVEVAIPAGQVGGMLGKGDGRR